MGSMEAIQKTQRSMDPCIIPNIQYARGFIERDLKPDSLWSKSTNAKKARLTDEAAGGSSSSSGLPTASSSTDVTASPELAFVRMHEITRLAK